MALSAPIVPVSPIADQTIAATNMSILIDFQNNPYLVRINNVLAYESGSGFLNGYTGDIITWTDGKRIVLNPPAAFTRDSTVPVHAEDDTVNELDYTFVATIDQMTDTDDASHPDIIDIDGTNIFVGYEKRDPTSAEIGAISINMRKHDPNTSEVEVITGSFVGFGTNPVSGKLITFININNVIYATEALASDLPATLSPVSDLLDYVAIAPGSGKYKVLTKQQFYSRKFIYTDDVPLTPGAGVYYSILKTPYESANPTPDIIGTDPVVLRIPRPTSEPEQSAIQGFYVARVYLPTNTISGGYDYIALPEGESFVDWSDSGKPYDMGYIIICVYQFNDDQVELINGPRSEYIEIPPFLGADIMPLSPGNGLYYVLTKKQFIPVSYEYTDTLELNTGVGRSYNVTVTGFGSKGIG